LVTNASRVGSALWHLGWLGCVSVLGLSLANYGLRFLRWSLYIADLGHRLPTRQLFVWYLAGFAFTVSPARAGEAVRSFYLREHGVPLSESVATLFVERLLDLLTVIVLASLIILVSASYSWLLITTAGMAAAVLIIAGRPVLPDWLSRWAASMKGPRKAKWLSSAAKLLRSSQVLLRPKLLLVGMFLGLAAWGAEGVGFNVLCSGLQLHLQPLHAIGIYAVATLAGVAAVFLPAGIGGMEAVMTTLLVGSGASLADAVIATLLCRIATLWFAVIIGLLATGWLTAFKSMPELAQRIAPES